MLANKGCKLFSKVRRVILSNDMDTSETEESVLIGEVSSFKELK